MREILAFKGRIKPMMELTLKFMSLRPELFGMQDVIYSLQMATYYIQESAEFIFQANKKEDIVHEGDRLFPMETPAIEDPQGILVYLFNQAAELSRDIFKFLSDVPVGQLSQMWLSNAISKITEAKFSIEITSTQYERLQNTGGSGLLSH